MLQKIVIVSITVATLMMAGCSGGEDMNPEDTVIGTQVEALNEAKKVEQLLIDTSRSRADTSSDDSTQD